MLNYHVWAFENCGGRDSGAKWMTFSQNNEDNNDMTPTEYNKRVFILSIAAWFHEFSQEMNASFIACLESTVSIWHDVYKIKYMPL